MNTITTQELKKRLEQDPTLLLINTLDREYFESHRIPKSRNVPLSKDSFVDEVKKIAGSKDREIVVYCASTDCDSSPKAAKMLEEAGFSNVTDFEAGLKGWQKAGNDIVGESVAATS